MGPLNTSYLISCIVAFLVLVSTCQTTRSERAQTTVDTVQNAGESSQKQMAIKPNLTLIGAIIVSVDTTDRFAYSVYVELRTAIPERRYESYAEPGQLIRIFPSYKLNEKGTVDVNDERNKRLMEVRAKKVGDFLFGKITMSSDSTWYLLDTELR